MAWPSTLVRTKNWGNEILTDSDLEGQYDLIIAWVDAAMDSTSGHDHRATDNYGTLINLNGANIGVTGELQETDGGTGLSAYTLGDILYASAANTLAALAGNTTTTKKFLSQTGDGAASAAPAWAALAATDLPVGAVVQVVNTITGALATGSTTMPADDTIPQNTEGDQYMTLAITPKATTNKLKIEVVACFGTAGTTVLIGAALFQDTTANALAAQISTFLDRDKFAFTHYMTAGTTSATTFKVRAGGSGGETITFNGINGARLFGGVMASSITITEIAAT